MKADELVARSETISLVRQYQTLTCLYSGMAIYKAKFENHFRRGNLIKYQNI